MVEEVEDEDEEDEDVQFTVIVAPGFIREKLGTAPLPLLASQTPTSRARRPKIPRKAACVDAEVKLQLRRFIRTQHPNQEKQEPREGRASKASERDAGLTRAGPRCNHDDRERKHREEKQRQAFTDVGCASWTMGGTLETRSRPPRRPRWSPRKGLGGGESLTSTRSIGGCC